MFSGTGRGRLADSGLNRFPSWLGIPLGAIFTAVNEAAFLISLFTSSDMYGRFLYALNLLFTIVKAREGRIALIT